MKKFFSSQILLLVATLAVVPAEAALVQIDSKAGLATSAGPSTVAITPHPLWQSNNPSGSSAVWISYKDSGYGGSQFQPYLGTTPVVSIFDSFTSGAGLFTLNVWADDTAEVFLDGVSLISPKFTQSSCSGQPIGCLPDDAGVFSLAIGAGFHTLEFVLYQVGTGTDTNSNPFGLLYSGTAPGAEAPEPAAFVLTGIGLAAVGLLRRRVSSSN